MALVLGVFVFGVIFGIRPNPVDSVRTVFNGLFGPQALVPGLLVITIILFLLGYISNKSLCGWGCQFGLLQDLLHRIPTPKKKIPTVFAYTLRAVAFFAMIISFALWGLDWLGWIDPFRIFRLQFVLPSLSIGIVSISVLLASSVFIYRSWCHLLCPFGFLSWLVEQVSFMKPRIQWDMCKKCKKCVSACPGKAMEGIYGKARIHSDCFTCGACIEACPYGAVYWGKSS